MTASTLSTQRTGAPVELTWIGQAGFVVAGAGVRILIDPFFSDYEGRAYSSPAAQPYIEGLSWLFVTHEHLDHLDPALFPELREHAPDLRIVVPAPLVDAVLEGGFDAVNVRGVLPGDKVALSDEARARVVPAFHALAANEPFGDGDTGSGPRFVGYVLELGSIVLYHPGDTVVTSELRAAVRELKPDIALLPVNGRDFYREEQNLVGNMDAREAVQFAAEIGTRMLIPMHWDMFTENAVRVGSVLDEVERSGAELHVVVPTRFRPISLA